MTKHELRKLYEPGPSAETADSFLDNALSVSELKGADSVFTYVSKDGEPSTYPLIGYALSAGKTVAVPLCAGKGEMTARVIRSVKDLICGKYGIPAPPCTAPELKKESTDVIILPCLFASRAGARLGHGAGYYDRFLSGCPAFRICLCFEKNLRETIPTDSRDEWCDCVVTENGVYRRSDEISRNQNQPENN